MSSQPTNTGDATKVVDERQPLLDPSVKSNGPSYQGDVEDPIAAREREEVDAADVPEIQEKVTWISIAWKAVLGTFITLAVVIIIRSFVKSGDDSKVDIGDALKKALGGGLSGAAAMVLQVATLMPLRTIMNYQYRFGTTFREATKFLYSDGGYGRYYRGVGAALIQGPLSRFGDTAANAGMLALLTSYPATAKLPSLIKSIFASLAAASFRMILTPVDTVKTTLQTQGRDGIKILRRRVKVNGLGSLWYGAIATAAATFVGHYPWFATYNFLYTNLPPSHNLIQKLIRQAVIGFAASLISDTVSNSLRVVKTYRQVNETKISYVNAAKAVIAQDGVLGLFIRGLGTRILTNGLQSIMFSILWKLFMDLWDSGKKV